MTQEPKKYVIGVTTFAWVDAEEFNLLDNYITVIM